jgi:hypothetical protein
MIKLLENNPHILKVANAAYRIFKKERLEPGY